MNLLQLFTVIAYNTTIIVYILVGFVIYKLIKFGWRLYKTLRLYFKLKKGKKVHDGPTVPRDN